MPKERHAGRVHATRAGAASAARRIDRTLAREIAEIRELSDGYALRFEPRPGLVEDLGRFIDAERLCCAFLDFSLRVRGDRTRLVGAHRFRRSQELPEEAS